MPEGITDAELASGLANVIMQQTMTTVRLLVDRDAARVEIDTLKKVVDVEGLLRKHDSEMYDKEAHALQTEIEESKLLNRKTNEVAELLRERVRLLEQLVQRLNARDSASLKDKIITDLSYEKELLLRKLSFFDGDTRRHIDAMLAYNLRVYLQAKADKAACAERFAQSEMRSEGLEVILKKWMHWAPRQLQITDTTSMLELLEETKAALASAEEQGLEREEIAIPSDDPTVGQSQAQVDKDD